MIPSVTLYKNSQKTYNAIIESIHLGPQPNATLAWDSGACPGYHMYKGVGFVLLILINLSWIPHEKVIIWSHWDQIIIFS